MSSYSHTLGENVLHMAIVNEDPAMVRFLLDRGVDINQRCCGQFFLPADQGEKGVNNPHQEQYDVPAGTDYQW